MTRKNTLQWDPDYEADRATRRGDAGRQALKDVPVRARPLEASLKTSSLTHSLPVGAVDGAGRRQEGT